MAEARGRAMIRPWRVGVLVDTASAEAVREAIANLSCVWGGRYVPILDIGAPIEELERLGRLHDVDSLYADVVEGPVGDLLRKPGWTWGFRGPWGPFGEENGFRTGLLPIRSFINTSTNFVQPTWDADEHVDLVLAATWGLGDHLGLPPLHASRALLRRVSTLEQAHSTLDTLRYDLRSAPTGCSARGGRHRHGGEE
jgi:hypothetical protein